MTQNTNWSNPQGVEHDITTQTGQSPAVNASDPGAIAVELHEGDGALAAVPAGSANGTSLGVLPVGANGVRLYCKPGDSISYTIAGAQPSSAPAATTTFATAAGAALQTLEERLTNEMVYVTAVVGTPSFRWY